MQTQSTFLFHSSSAVLFFLYCHIIIFKTVLNKISFKKEGLPSCSECFNFLCETFGNFCERLSQLVRYSTGVTGSPGKTLSDVNIPGVSIGGSQHLQYSA